MGERFFALPAFYPANCVPTSKCLNLRAFEMAQSLLTVKKSDKNKSYQQDINSVLHSKTTCKAKEIDGLNDLSESFTLCLWISL